MGLLTRIFGRGPQGPDLGPLWHQVVAIAREKEWYAQCGVADSVAGRFDMITAVLALVLVRMESEEGLRGLTARLTERFVADMDGQLRQNGIGDLVVGKHMGRLVSTLGGRLDAYRAGLAAADPSILEAALQRNVTLLEGAGVQQLADRIRALAGCLAASDAASIAAGRIAR